MSILRIIKKYNQLLTGHQKARVLQLGMLMVLGGLLETVSVSLMIPLIEGILNTEEMMNKWYAGIICNFLQIDTERGFLICLSLILAAIFILKNIYLVFEYNIQYKFVYYNMFEMQKKLLDIFIHRPYEYFMSVNSGETIRVINQDVVVVYSLLATLLLMFTEIVITVMLIIGIFVIAPVITICVAIILVAIVLLIYLNVKPILKREGQRRNDALTEMNKWLIQSIQGIKEIKVMKKEPYFKANFERYGSVYVRSQRISSVLGVLPRFIVEGSCLSSMFIAVAVMVFLGVNLESLIPVLTAVAMAAIRLLPSVNRISSYLNQMAYGEPTIDKVLECMNEIEEYGKSYEVMKDGNVMDEDRVDNGFGLENSIKVNDLSYCYPNSAENVLYSVSLAITKGDSIGIVGASGAGKTTLVDVLLGLLKPQGGEVKADGVNIADNLPAWLDRIGYIPQTIFMLDGTIRENIAFGEEPANVSDDNVWRVLDEAALKDFVESTPDGLDTQIGERGMRISGGQRQRIGIARALYTNPDVLIFDEATSALDNETESEIMHSIDKLHGKKTLIIIAHRLSTIEACDHVFRVEDGKVLKER